MPAVTNGSEGMRDRDLAAYFVGILAFAGALAVVWPPDPSVPHWLLVPSEAAMFVLVNASGLMLCISRWPRSRRARCVAWVALFSSLCLQAWLSSWVPLLPWLVGGAAVGCVFGVVARIAAAQEGVAARQAR